MMPSLVRTTVRVGQGFSVSAYRLDGPDGPTLLFTASNLAPGDGSSSTALDQVGTMPPPILLEAASWLNQSERIARPIQVTATARSYEQADRLARMVMGVLAPRVLGDPARIRSSAVVAPDAPEAGTLAIGPAR